MYVDFIHLALVFLATACPIIASFERSYSTLCLRMTYIIVSQKLWTVCVISQQVNENSSSTNWWEESCRRLQDRPHLWAFSNGFGVLDEKVYLSCPCEEVDSPEWHVLLTWWVSRHPSISCWCRYIYLLGLFLSSWSGIYDTFSQVGNWIILPDHKVMKIFQSCYASSRDHYLLSVGTKS